MKEIKDSYAKSVGYEDWLDLMRHTGDYGKEPHIDKVMKLYAMECLKKASDIIIEWSYERYPNFNTAKQSIYNENNLV